MPGHTVSVQPGWQTGRTFYGDGTTFHQWAFIVTVDGEVGIYTDLADTDDPAYEADMRDQARADIEEDPGRLWRQSIDVDEGGLPDVYDPPVPVESDSPAEAGGATQSQSSDDFWASLDELGTCDDPNAGNSQSADPSGDSNGDDSSGGDSSGGDDTSGGGDASGGGDTGGGPTGGGDDGTGGGDGGTDNPDGGGDEGPSLGHHSHRTSHTGVGATSNTGSGYTGDPDGGEGGWGWAHFGSPRANDGDGGGDEGPSLGHHGGHGDSGHGGRPRGGSGQIGSVDDQQYEGGGYGWTTLGAPRATPGSVGSAGVTMTPDSAPWPSGPRRFGWVLIGAALLALPIGALVLKFGGQAQPDTPVIPAVVISTPTLAPTTTAVPPPPSSPQPSPSAQVRTNTPAVPRTSFAATTPPSTVTQAVTAPTTSVAPQLNPSVIISTRPVGTVPPTSVRKPAPPASSTTHKRHGGGSDTNTAGGDDGSARAGSAGVGSDTSARG